MSKHSETKKGGQKTDMAQEQGSSLGPPDTGPSLWKYDRRDESWVW